MAADALRDAAARLAAVSDSARLDAELLMAHALGCSREELLLRLPSVEAPAGFGDLIERRMAREPVAYIAGAKEFWGLSLAVSPAVLIPRGDSETLIETALDLFADRPPESVLDLGTGSGALLIAALSEFGNATGLGIDRSEAALDVARANAAAHYMTSRARFAQGDWSAAGWDDVPGAPFDLVLANPPYVAERDELHADVALHEPKGALFAGADGLDDYRRIVPRMPGLLAKGGAGLIEIGAAQGAVVRELARQAGLAATVRHDLSGRDRVVVVTRAA